MLRILAGLARPDGGEVCWRGRSTLRDRAGYQQDLLFIGHQPGIKAVLTPFENLQFYQAVRGTTDHPAIWRALEQVGLVGYEDLPVAQLSAGQQRRVALARLWLSAAPLWILDEPLTAIDKQGVAELISLFEQHAQRGGMVLLTTHQDLAGVSQTVGKVRLAEHDAGPVMFLTLVRRELKIACRKGSEIVNPLWFFLIVITLFPLGIGPEPQLLARIAPGIVWVAALLASLLSLERLFRDDFLDGSLEQLLLLPTPLPMTVLGKVCAHWVVTGLPLLILSPLVALLLSLDMQTWLAVAGTLLLGTPTLSLIGAIGVGLTVGLRKGGVLLSLLVLPLYIPVLIFATGAIDAASMGMPIDGYLAILGAMLAGSVTLAPFATAAALRVSVH